MDVKLGMHGLADSLPEKGFQPGTNVLVAGPPMTGKRTLAFDILANGVDRGGGSIVVSTEDDATTVLEAIDESVDDLQTAPKSSGADAAVAEAATTATGSSGGRESTAGSRAGGPVGVVDCVTKQRGVGTVEDDPRVKYASSPVDMTGIGISLSAFLEEFYEGRGVTENRVLLHSVSTLLLYSNLQTVFRFLHVFTGRVQSADATGIYVIDSTAHDGQTMNTLKQLFDAVIELEDGEDGTPNITTAGFSS
ncbi:RecA-superfamily ATPase, KaiC/GvpD/RAD55 family [Natronorubrum daqingense]|uniref:RecA-superfamily ATPase, KaiC/GvpD/RAD55 family n=2 Tax=Natronorubrum daqingense TaxID=588898 RepID=A0A1N6Y9Q5_9EURY|nr:RecA-superfamily ATPase, KaiC/GvpD/RAD55 family [Natronorubrum daqingense]